MIIHLDFETTSPVDLRDAGVHTYAEHPETRIIAMAWAIEDGLVQTWRWGEHESERNSLFDAIEAGGVLHAFNAEFEWVIWNRFMAPLLPVSRFRCTMARAQYWGLPGSLEKVATALDTGWQKDTVGKGLMQRMARPRRVLGDGSYTWWHEDDPGRLAGLVAYCATDVETERDIGNLLAPMPKAEQQLWELNCEMNLHGVGVDEELVDRAIGVANDEAIRLNEIVHRRTNHEVNTTNQVAKLKDWFVAHGAAVEGCAKPEMERVKDDIGLDKNVRAVAAARLLAAKSSTKKYRRMQLVSGGRGRLRGLTKHYGASRTGRYAGWGVQCQNLPRPALGHDDLAVARLALKGDFRGCAKALGVNPLNLMSDLVRTMLVPCGAGHRFVIGDLGQIEARMLAWLARQNDVLDVFRRGDDVYVHAAKKIGSDQRQLGKVLTLACGYQMGAVKFQETASGYGLELSPGHAELAVSAWRGANDMITAMWYGLEDAVKRFVTRPGERDALNDMTQMRWRIGLKWLDGGHLGLRLPSGRYLVYRDMDVEVPGGPRDRYIDGTYSAKGPFLVYRQVNQKTGQWGDEQTYGGKLVENVTQAAARDVLARALWMTRRVGLVPVLTVHDEIVCEFDLVKINDDGARAALAGVMTASPRWARDLPLASDVFVSDYYRK
jgi:DNA polymerase